MRNFTNLGLSAVVIAVVAIVLVGQQFDARWLGGTGRVDPCPAHHVGSPQFEVRRGEVMSTETGESDRNQMCDGSILYLDANTQIRLSAYRNTDLVASQNTQLELIQGRVIVDGLADVKTRNTIVSVNGAGCEIVHYSWLDKVDVTPLVESGCKIESLSAPLEARQTLRLNTFNSAVESTSPFNPQASSAAAFYNWTGLQLETLPEVRNDDLGRKIFP